MESRPSSSLEYVQVEIHCTLPSGTEVNLTGDAVELAFLEHGEPIEADWHTAEWDPAAVGRNVARVLVGPGGPVGTPTLDEGRWKIFARVHADPEMPVLLVDELAIT